MPEDFQSFETTAELEAWFASNHATASELRVRIYRKESGIRSVDWNDCVLTAIAWGWIDGHKKSLDSSSYVQRLTPRRARSNWSKKNCAHAERLIQEGRMQPAGMAQVEAARNDGRWERAYGGISNMEMPSEFLSELEKHPAAKEFYATLDRTNLFSIYYRVHTAKRPETRARRIAEILAKLERRERYH